VYVAVDGIGKRTRRPKMDVREGDIFRCPVDGCGCEIRVTSTPAMEATQSFVDCCGHEMENVD
jgi:hypothetical protein